MSDVSSGIRAWVAMFGDGGRPVSIRVAESRADFCRVCPVNDKTKKFVPLLASMWRAVLEIKHRESLKLINEHELGVCTACGDCDLKLKPWSPIHVVMRDMTPEKFERLWEKCWIRSENHEQKGQP